MLKVEKKVTDLLHRTEAIKQGHFVLTSGDHSDTYIDKFKILNNPLYVKYTIMWLRKHITNKNSNLTYYDLVGGPTQGGSILAYELARQVGIRYFIIEKGIKGRVIKRTPDILSEETPEVILLDDIFTTGKSIKESMWAIEEINPYAKIKAMIVIVNRNKEYAKYKDHTCLFYDNPLYWMASVPMETYRPEECPFCN